MSYLISMKKIYFSIRFVDNYSLLCSYIHHSNPYRAIFWKIILIVDVCISVHVSSKATRSTIHGDGLPCYIRGYIYSQGADKGIHKRDFVSLRHLSVYILQLTNLAAFLREQRKDID